MPSLTNVQGDGDDDDKKAVNSLNPFRDFRNHGAVSLLESKPFFFGALMVLSAILGGCVGSESANGTEGKDVTQVGELSEDKGGVRGLVMTDELAPIKGAQVGIAALALVASTDESGSFSIAGLPPGRHVLSAIALGYNSGSVSVEVTAGVYTEGIQFLLGSLAVRGPHHTTELYVNVMEGQMLKATPTCMYPMPGQATVKTCVGVGGCSDSAPEGCDSEAGYGHCGDDGPDGDHACDFTPDWQTIIGEVAWVPTSSATGRGFIWEILTPNVTRSNGHGGSVDQSDPHDFMHLDSKSPIRTIIDRDVLAGNKEPWEGAGTRTIPESDWCGGIEGEYVEGRCDFHWRLFPGWCTIHGLTGGAAGCGETGPDAGIMTDQKVEIYFTYFIGEPAPADWTALPDI